MGQLHSSPEWLQLLHNTTVHDVIKARDKAAAAGQMRRPDHLVQLKSTNKLSEALAIFKENSIQSAPVWSDSAHGDMGFFDLLDAVAVIARGAPRTGAWQIPPKVLDEPILHMINYSKKDDAVEIGYNTTLKKVFDVMNRSHLHRLAVLDVDRQRVVDVITQSDALMWICQHANEPHMKDVAELSLKDLGLAQKKEMLTCHVNDLTLWAYAEIAKHKISAMPVVDEGGQIIGALSGYQLRGLGSAETDPLLLPVGKFLEVRKHHALNYCIPSTTFGAAVTMMHNQQLHRLFIVNPHNLHPISVLTLSDVLRTLNK